MIKDALLTYSPGMSRTTKALLVWCDLYINKYPINIQQLSSNLEKSKNYLDKLYKAARQGQTNKLVCRFFPFIKTKKI